MRCQSANLDFKFIFHQLMSADCNIVRQFITQQWGGQLFSRPKLHKSTPSFLRFRDIFYFLLPTVSDSSAPRCDSDPLSAAQEAATPTTHWVTVWGLSYQTYQIFNNKHLNRSSLSALRTNDPPWWLCSSSLPRPEHKHIQIQTASCVDKKCTQHYNQHYSSNYQSDVLDANE